MTLLLKLGQAKGKAGRAYGLVEVIVPESLPAADGRNFTFRLRQDKLRETRRREGRYLLRSNMKAEDPARLWENYLRLVEVEAARNRSVPARLM